VIGLAQHVDHEGKHLRGRHEASQSHIRAPLEADWLRTAEFVHCTAGRAVPPLPMLVMRLVATIALGAALASALIAPVDPLLVRPSGLGRARAPFALGMASVVDENALPDSKRRLSEISVKVVANLAPEVINYLNLVESVKDLEIGSSQPSFWDDQVSAQATMSELNRLKDMVKRVDTWRSGIDDSGALIQMAVEDEEEAGMTYDLDLSYR
jgi:hypothetical protein